LVGRAGVEPKIVSAETAKACALPHQQRGAKSGALAHDSGLADPPAELAPALKVAWATLSPEARQDLLALARARARSNGKGNTQ